MTSPATVCEFSLATPPGRGGISVIVVTGPAAGELVGRIFKPWKSHTNDTEGALRLGHVLDETGATIDEAVLCRRGTTYEINIHGGPLVAKATMDLLQRLGARRNAAFGSEAQARRECGMRNLPVRQAGAESLDQLTLGEGTLSTAFNPSHPQWNNPAIGVEMLELLPSARSELVVQALTSQWSDGLSRLAREVVSEVEIPHLPAGQAGSAFRIPHLSSPLRAAARGLASMNALLSLAEVVLVGPPNAGKSTLVNALAGRAVSIVHERPGTTRDWVRELALLDGVPVYITDTAGLWEEADGIDAQAVARARERALAADLVLLCGAGAAPPVPLWLSEKLVLRVALQADRFAGDGEAVHADNQTAPTGKPAAVRLSAQTGQGLSDLKQAVIDALGLRGLDPRMPMAFTQRQADLLTRAAHGFDAATPASLRDAATCLRACLEA